MFGSVRRLAFNSDDMSISVSSWRKLFIAVSLIALYLTYFFRFIVFSEIPRFTIHSRWSDIWLSIMEDEMATCFFYGEFCRISDQWGCRSASQIWWKKLFWEWNYLCTSSRKIRQIFRVRKFVINLYWNLLQSLHTCFRFEVSPLLGRALTQTVVYLHYYCYHEEADKCYQL